MKRALWAVIAVSCTSSTNTGTGTDASTGHQDAAGSGGSAMIDAPVSGGGDAALPCKASSGLHGDGHHNAGQDCMGGCHFHGFAFAGTLMQADGVTPAVGATVTVVDANNNSQDVVVGDNGNFYTFFPVAFPIRVQASLCPSTQVMTTHPTKGGCNATDCHGGTQGLAHL